MSIHPSLRSSTQAGAAGRNVLKRHERVRHLMDLGVWADDQIALGLPKIKQLRIKTRKAVKEKTEDAAAGGGAAAPAAAAGAAPAGKSAAGKPAAGKPAA